jgi:hypothetical protein
MPSDKLVQSQDLLYAVMEVRRRGNQKLIEELEAREPELAEYVLEELTVIHQKIAAVGARTKQIRALDRRIEGLMHVVAQALRAGYGRLLADFDPDGTDPDSGKEANGPH